MKDRLLDRNKLVIFSNCLGAQFAKLLNSVPAFNRHFGAIFVGNYSKMKGFDARERKHMEDADIFLYQVRHLEDDGKYFDFLPPDCTKISFPSFTMQPLWPLYCGIPQLGYSDDSCPMGRFPYGDTLALRLLAKDLSPEEAFKQYMQTDLTSVVDIKRLTEIYFSKLHHLDAKSDIKMGSLIENNLSSRRQFKNIFYPEAPFLLEMGAKLLSDLGFGKVPFMCSRYFLAMAEEWYYNVPIHPQVIEHFDLKWVRQQDRYLYLKDLNLTFEEYMKRYFQNDVSREMALQQDPSHFLQRSTSTQQEEGL